MTTGFIDLWHDERLDSTENLHYILPASDPKVELVVEDQEFEWEGKWWITRRTELERRGAELVLAVESDALWYRLSETTYVGSIVLTDVGAASGLDLILENTGWSRGVKTDDGPSASAVFSFEDEDASHLSLVRSWAEVCGLFVEFDTTNRTVDLVSTRGRNLGTAFRYGRNLESIKRRVVPPVCTRLYAYGGDDLTFAGINGNLEYIEDYSFYTDQGLTLAEARARYTKTKVIADTKFLTDTALLAWARTQLADMSQPTIEYECKVVDLSDLDVPGTDARIADTAIVHDGPLGLSVQTTVVRTKRYPLQPWRNEIELAHLYKANNTSSATSGRGSASQQWLLFKHDNLEVISRMESSATLNRIGLKFREGGEAVFGYDINFVGVGTGSVSVSALDWNGGEPILQHQPLTLPFTDGQQVHDNMTWALQGLSGLKDYRIRTVVTTDGGPASTTGVDFPAAYSRFWILAHGAVRETPTTPNQQIFSFNGNTSGSDGTVQQFTVPDGVTEVTVEAMGAAGGQDGFGGAGATALATFAVVPGQVLDVYVGGQPGGTGVSGSNSAAGWPNGGLGGPTRSGAPDTGSGGGGASFVTGEGLTIADAWVVGAGGGGSTEHDGNVQFGGDAGYPSGEDGGPEAADERGGGAGQYNGGSGGVGNTDQRSGSPGTFGQGGNAGDQGGTSIFSFMPAGGGGGWYGGGGGGRDGATLVEGGGGGGSSYVDPDRCWDYQFTNGANPDTGLVPKSNGLVTITWPTPDIPGE